MLTFSLSEALAIAKAIKPKVEPEPEGKSFGHSHAVLKAGMKPMHQEILMYAEIIKTKGDPPTYQLGRITHRLSIARREFGREGHEFEKIHGHIIGLNEYYSSPLSLIQPYGIKFNANGEPIITLDKNDILPAQWDML